MKIEELNLVEGEKELSESKPECVSLKEITKFKSLDPQRRQEYSFPFFQKMNNLDKSISHYKRYNGLSQEAKDVKMAKDRAKRKNLLETWSFFDKYCLLLK